MGPSKLSAAQIAAWFRSATHSPYRATIPVDQLAAAYVNEGALAAVRGDIAFAQSVVETGWFSFPAGGYVQPADNNFAGIGAYGDGSHLMRAPDAQTGVRTQVQLLRRYADPGSNHANIGSTPSVLLWNPASRYDIPGGTHGWAPTWESMTGRWASSPTYAATVLGVYRSMLTFNGLSPNASFSSDAFGSLDAASATPSGFRVSGWAINPLTTGPDTVHVYVDGTFAGAVTANASRPDIGSAYKGYGNSHGFAAIVPSSVTTQWGTHSVCAYALGGVNPMIGCQTVTVQPFGYVGGVSATPTGVQVSGWAVNPQTTGADTVHVYVDGVFAGAATANGARTGLGAWLDQAGWPGYGDNHTFTASVGTPGALSYGPHSVCVYALGGPNPNIGCRTYNRQPFGNIESLSSTPTGVQAVGWAVDPQTTGADTVHFYVDGVFAGAATAPGNRPGLGAWLDQNGYVGYGDNHTFTAALTSAAATQFGTHTVCAYALGGVNPSIGCQKINTKPLGFLESAESVSGGIQAIGWGVNPQTAGPATVHFYVDGVFAGARQAGTYRPGLGGWFDQNGYVGYGDYHTFGITVPASSGSHWLCAYVLGGTNPNIGCRIT